MQIGDGWCDCKPLQTGHTLQGILCSFNLYAVAIQTVMIVARAQRHSPAPIAFAPLGIGTPTVAKKKQMIARIIKIKCKVIVMRLSNLVKGRGAARQD